MRARFSIEGESYRHSTGGKENAVHFQWPLVPMKIRKLYHTALQFFTEQVQGAGYLNLSTVLIYFIPLFVFI